MRRSSALLPAIEFLKEWDEAKPFRVIEGHRQTDGEFQTGLQHLMTCIMEESIDIGRAVNRVRVAKMKRMPNSERVRFFPLLASHALQEDNFTHEQVFGETHHEPFSASEAAEYLEVSLPTLRR